MRVFALLLLLVACNSKTEIKEIVSPKDHVQEAEKLKLPFEKSNDFRGKHINLHVFEMQDQHDEAALFKSGNGFPLVILKKSSSAAKKLIHSLGKDRIGSTLVVMPSGYDKFSSSGSILPAYEIIQLCGDYQAKNCKNIEDL